MTARKYYGRAQLILIIMIIQAVFGLIVVRGQMRETTAKGNSDGIAILEMREQDMRSRLDAYDKLDIPSRLAVIERQDRDQKEIMSELRYVAYGIFITVVGGLIAQLVVISGNKERTRGYKGNEDEE